MAGMFNKPRKQETIKDKWREFAKTIPNVDQQHPFDIMLMQAGFIAGYKVCQKEATEFFNELIAEAKAHAAAQNN